MKEIEKQPLSFHTDHEHVHAFFQDLGMALNRIMELHSQNRNAPYESNLAPFLPVPVENSVD